MISYKDMAEIVKNLAAYDLRAKRWGANKAFISSVWEAFDEDYSSELKQSLEVFKSTLVHLQTLGLIRLSRHDMPDGVDKDISSESETKIEIGGIQAGVVHFIDI
jgi:hypothetical protein